eukprot:6205667-Pleurochrysis_carterae.AAC.1
MSLASQNRRAQRRWRPRSHAAAATAATLRRETERQLAPNAALTAVSAAKSDALLGAAQTLIHCSRALAMLCAQSGSLAL